MLRKRHRFALVPAKDLIKRRVQAVVRFAGGQKDVSSLFHIAFYAGGHAVQIGADHIEIRAVVPDGFLKFKNDEEAARDSDAKRRFAQKLNIRFQHFLPALIRLLVMDFFDGGNHGFDVGFL